MIMVSLGMLYAGSLEVYRMKLYSEGYTRVQKIGDRSAISFQF